MLKTKLKNKLSRLVGTDRLLAELAELRVQLRDLKFASTSSKLAQLSLIQQWRSICHRKEPLPKFEDVEFRCHSQNGEDGLLLFIFAIIGTTNRYCVEVCAGDGVTCNATNLLVNHHWTGLLFDGNEALIGTARRFFSQHPDTFCFPPKLVHAWITREGINDLIRSNGMEGDIDLLSLDLDGVDYWIWEAIDVIRPRVVIAETQCLWGSDRSVTVPYRSDFQSPLVNGFGVYSGASLPAFVKLGRRKGYRLVGVQSLGFNAIFVREGLGEDLLPEVPASSIESLPFVQWANRELRPLVQNLDWVEV